MLFGKKAVARETVMLASDLKSHLVDKLKDSAADGKTWKVCIKWVWLGRVQKIGPTSNSTPTCHATYTLGLFLSLVASLFYIILILNNLRNTKKHKGRYLKYAPNMHLMHPLNVIFYLFYSLQRVSFSSSVELPFPVSLSWVCTLHSALFVRKLMESSQNSKRIRL